MCHIASHLLIDVNHCSEKKVVSIICLFFTTSGWNASVWQSHVHEKQNKVKINIINKQFYVQLATEREMASGDSIGKFRFN